MALNLVWASALFALFVAFLALGGMGLFGRNQMPVEGRTVLLTGASQGMGKSVARILSSKGANIIIVARDQKKLETAVNEMKAAAKNPNKQRFHTISADVSVASENARIIREATAWNNGYPPDIVWQIAGAAKPTLFLDSTLETMHSQMDLNYWAAIYLARETLQAWLPPSSLAAPFPPEEAATRAEPQARHLIFTSSIAALVGVAGYSPYCPAKAAMRSFSDALRSELEFYNGARRQPAASRDPKHPPPPTDMYVHTVIPGTIDSPGLVSENQSKHDLTLMIEEVDPVQQPDAVAAGAIAGLEKGQYMVIPHWFNRFMAGSGWQGSPRSSWFLDTGLAWVTSLVWLYVGWDIDNQVRKYGQKWGLKGKPKDVKKWF